MNAKKRCQLPGTFVPREMQAGAWRLSRSGPEAIEVILTGADAPAAEALRASGLADLDIEWQDGAVALTWSSSGGRRAANVRAAIVHQPLGTLYEALPLAEFDEKARRFWRRVFGLVRIPGGRHLLLAIARRNRGGH